MVDAKQKGFITYVKVYSGTLKRGEKLLNTSSGQTERALDVFDIDAEALNSVPTMGAGYVGALSGLKETATGDTLVSANTKSPVVLPGVSVCQPVFFRSIEPRTSSEASKLGEALVRLQIEDPSFRVKYDDTTHQTLISGMGELHLEIIYDRLVKHYGVEASIGPIMIAYTSVLTEEGEHALSEHMVLPGRGGKGDSVAHIDATLRVLDLSLIHI